MLTSEDIRELLKSRKPVIHHCLISASYSDIEYDYINALIIRYNPKRNKFERTLELMDKNRNALATAFPADVRRKIPTESEAE